jgi:hypothetical protein
LLPSKVQFSAEPGVFALILTYFVKAFMTLQSVLEINDAKPGHVARGSYGIYTVDGLRLRHYSFCTTDKATHNHFSFLARTTSDEKSLTVFKSFRNSFN